MFVKDNKKTIYVLCCSHLLSTVKEGDNVEKVYETSSNDVCKFQQSSNCNCQSTGKVMMKKQSSLYNLKHKEGRDVAPETMSPQPSHSLPTNENCIHKVNILESNIMTNNDCKGQVATIRSMQDMSSLKNWQLIGNISSPGWLFDKSIVQNSKSQCKAFVSYQCTSRTGDLMRMHVTLPQLSLIQV